MSETRKLAAILVADVVGYSRLAGADEDRTLARLRGLRSDLIDPAITAHHGRIVKRTGDGSQGNRIWNSVASWARFCVWTRWILPVAADSRRGRLFWIALSNAGTVWTTRALEMPHCTTFTKSWR